MADFYAAINESRDLKDHLQYLVEYLKELTKSTAVYIGKYEPLKRRIKSDDDDKAHISEEGEKYVVYSHATEGHKYLVNKVLRPDQGVTFDVFKDDEEVPENEEQQQQQEVGEENENEEQQQVYQEPKEKFPKYIYVKEVVRNDKMHFFRVPKLGAYLAIRLEYDSCQSETALDNAIVDFVEVRQRQKEQDEEKRQYYDKMSDEVNEDNEEVKIEERQWEDIQRKPFISDRI